MTSGAVNRLSLSGLAATLVGNGIGRFAFIALMPALIQEGWFTKGEASYLSVATLVGYLLGAGLSDLLGSNWRVSTLLRMSMLTCSVSFFACAFENAGLPWYFFWRTLAGFSGAILMVLPAPVVLPAHAPATRGRASGVVFSGIGLGAVISGALVPSLIAGTGLIFVVSGDQFSLWVLQGVTGAWIGMGCICLVLTALAWRQWPPDADASPKAAATGQPAKPFSAEARVAVGLILIAHGLNAIGYLAHTLFWVDYIVRELHMPLATGGFYWSMFGLGAAIGPLVTGSLADVFGLKRCLIAAFLLKFFAAALPLLSNGAVALFISSFLMGMFTPGIVALISAYALDRVGPAHHRKAWGMATLSFAAAQAGGGLLMAMLAVSLSSYRPLFAVSAVALLGALACIAAIRAVATPLPAAPLLLLTYQPKEQEGAL
jgi:MFS family permease